MLEELSTGSGQNGVLVFGVLSGVLTILGYIPYIIDTLKKRTQPERASWLIWSTIGSIAFFSQVYEGATNSLWFAGMQVSGTIIIFLLSIKLGAGEYLSRKNQIIFFVAFCGLVAWYFTETAVYALAISISIGLLGGIVTVQKAYQDPESETISTWVLALLASVCAVISVGKIDWVILAFPLYLLTLYTAIVAAMLLGRMKKSAHLERHGLSYGEHFRNNWSFTILALKSAFYTLGHALTPRISGQRASELHNELWREGRKASLQDLNHRLNNGFYANKSEALEDYENYAVLYDEEPLMTRFKNQIELHYS